MSLLDRRVRGFRLVDLVALGLLVVLILGVYLAKTIAGRERAEIARIERQIAAEKARIRLLQAEVSHLEQPSRIERLSTAYLGLVPVSVKREASTDTLLDVARNPAPPVVVVPPPAEVAPAVAEETGAEIEAGGEEGQ
ncbi:cell division protein [Phenylobacterium sp.]|uniref:cell division protein FtsL n=1 Tax=Phenylobacterium sp. TaxID=1871053 RepID=UPI0035AF1DE9